MTGNTLGHYQIVAEIGRGGMGVVYKAFDDRLKRSVALKVLPAHLVENHDRRARFVQEARAASSLNHPNIITVYDVAEIDDTIYIAMEFVAGKPLGEYIPARG